jgi:putative thioredoxin
MQAVIALAEAAQRPPGGDPLGAAYAASLDKLVARDHRGALEDLLAIVEKNRRWNDEAARKTMLAIFQLLGVRSPTSDEYRRRLALLL